MTTQAIKVMWIALRRCGCCVGAAHEDGASLDEAERKALEAEGIYLHRVSVPEWEAVYRESFLAECPHRLRASQ